MLKDPSKSIPSEKLAMKFVLIEFETLATNMLKNSNKILLASKVAKTFEERTRLYIR